MKRETAMTTAPSLPVVVAFAFVFVRVNAHAAGRIPVAVERSTASLDDRTHSADRGAERGGRRARRDRALEDAFVGRLATIVMLARSIFIALRARAKR